jgi:hypothetical protein
MNTNIFQHISYGNYLRRLSDTETFLRLLTGTALAIFLYRTHFLLPAHVLKLCEILQDKTMAPQMHVPWIPKSYVSEEHNLDIPKYPSFLFTVLSCKV